MRWFAGHKPLLAQIAGMVRAERANPSSSSNNPDQIFRNYLRYYRAKHLRQRTHDRRGRKKHVKSLARSIYRHYLRFPRTKLPIYTLSSYFTHSPILEALRPGRRERWVPILKRDRNLPQEIVELKDLSFIRNPAGTLAALKHLGQVEERAVAARINFEDEYCTDVGAYLVLAEIWPSMAKVFSGGKMNPAVQKVIEAVNLKNSLHMKLAVNDVKDVWAFDVKRRRPTGSSKSPQRHLQPQRKEIVADQFCDVLDEWLNVSGLELSDGGKSRFANIITEMLDNAERHSEPISQDGSWTIAAFMARRTEQEANVYRCYIAFLSIGATVAETLERAAPDVKQDVANYVRLHNAAQGQTPETLATLIAIQEGITCDPGARAKGRGGVGLPDVISFINALGTTMLADCEPRMTIISGRACVELRAPYNIVKRPREGEPRVLWCNAANSPHEPPDPGFVYELPDRFPGTLVSVEFVLDHEFLKSKVDALDKSQRADQ